jgi:hypothetical protein
LPCCWEVQQGGGTAIKKKGKQPQTGSSAGPTGIGGQVEEMLIPKRVLWHRGQGQPALHFGGPMVSFSVRCEGSRRCKGHAYLLTRAEACHNANHLHQWRGFKFGKSKGLSRSHTSKGLTPPL